MRVVIAALLVAVVMARMAPLSESEYQRQFVKFVGDYQKTYDASQMFTRFNTFKYWVDYVRNHNTNNNSTWEAGINEFSDLSPAEFKKIYLSGLILDLAEAPEPSQEVDLSALPNDVDWRGKAVTPVKNQGQCGSCWAFSATGAMEGYSATKKGSLPSLSEQQMVDCAGSSGNQGCNGGWPNRAIQWAKQGSASESAYPYTGRQGTCKKPSATFTPPGARTGSGEPTLASQLNSFPVSVCVDASGGFQSYKGGIFQGPCGSQLNHAILAVGYTSSYWIVKNSWGTGWGSGGYIYMGRGKNLCGVNNNLAWVG